ncbi:MAG: 30S ribosome-binding factor RbfA [Candidatus Eisenbacteria bacterium]
MRYKRSERVSALILQEVAGMIEEGLKNPNIGFVTVTAVEVSDDLRHAKIYVVPHGDDAERARTLKALDDSLPWIRRELARTLDLKYVPTLAFRADRSFDHADRINRLLDEIHEEEKD